MSTREPSAPPAASVAEARMVEEKGDLIEFTYGWPAEAAAIPALDARLEADLTKQRDEARAMAREDKDARSPDAPFHGHSFVKDLKNYGETPRRLPLAAQVPHFTGGPHRHHTV